MAKTTKTWRMAMSPNRPNKSNKSTCQYPWITADTENGGSYNSYPIIHFQYQLSQGSISWYKIDTGHDFTPNLPKKLPNKSPICPFLFHGLADGVTIHIQQRQQHADVGQDHLSSSKKWRKSGWTPPDLSKKNGWFYSENVMISEQLESNQRTLLVWLAKIV